MIRPISLGFRTTSSSRKSSHRKRKANLRGKKAILTGASTGLGRTLALKLAEQGVDLALAARRLEALEDLAQLIRGQGGKAIAVATDVTRSADCQSFVKQAVDHLGGVDYLILNAGVSMWARLEEISDVSIFERVMATNYLGVVYCIHAALPNLIESRGLIVTVSSTQAVLGMPHHTGYTASKHAVKGFLEALEFEMDGRIRLLNVMPGWIRGTDMRANAFVGDGTETGSTRRHSSESVSAEECADAMIRAIKSGQRELFIPAKLRTVPWLKLLAPGWLRRKIRRVVAAQPESKHRRIRRKKKLKSRREITEG